MTLTWSFEVFESLFVSECDLQSENLFLLEESLSNLEYNFECFCEQSD